MCGVLTARTPAGWQISPVQMKARWSQPGDHSRKRNGWYRVYAYCILTIRSTYTIQLLPKGHEYPPTNSMQTSLSQRAHKEEEEVHEHRDDTSQLRKVFLVSAGRFVQCKRIGNAPNCAAHYPSRTPPNVLVIPSPWSFHCRPKCKATLGLSSSGAGLTKWQLITTLQWTSRPSKLQSTWS